MYEVNALQEERTNNFQSIFDSKIPNRVPVELVLGIEYVAQFSGLDLMEVQWNPWVLTALYNIRKLSA